MLGEAGVTLTDILLLFIGTVVNFTLIRFLIRIFPDFWESVGISLFIFIFPSFIGGFITGDLILGTIAGFTGFLPFELAKGQHIGFVPFLFSSIGGFIGGLLRKTLFKL